jgi:hydrogenase maturation protease
VKTLILGIGNLLWADEGFGVRCVETLDAMYAFEDSVEVMDGGTQGIYLIHHVRDANNLVVFDAIDYGLEPGTVKVIRDDAVPNFMGCKKMSLHQTGFQEVLSAAKLMGGYPDRIALIGVQPESIEDFGGSLTPKVEAQLEHCIKTAVDLLQDWGIQVTRRSEPKPKLVQKELDKTKYETERPPEDVALRIGDKRVLMNGQFKLREKPLHQGISNVKSVPIDGRKLFESK